MTNDTSALSGLSALGDPTRRTVFERVAARPSTVSEIANGLPVSRPAVSQHLKVLKEAGLVVDSPMGTRRVYRINPSGLSAIRNWLDTRWAQSLGLKWVAWEQTDPPSYGSFAYPLDRGHNSN